MLLIEPAGPAAARLRWSVSAADWARLDAEFPGSAGVTEPVARLRLIRRNGAVAEVATERLGDPALARSGVVEVALAEEGDYEAELGLATADGGWLVLLRSARWHWSRSGGRGDPEPIAGGRAPEDDSPERPLAVASAVYPPVWGLLPPAVGQAAPAAESSPSPRAGGATERPPRWGEGPAAAGYAAVPGGAGGVQVRAEVILYGSAPPGTLVDLYGRRLRVGPGGAFSLRFDLDDPELLRRILAEASQPPQGPTVASDEPD
jgi:hypothetical protein